MLSVELLVLARGQIKKLYFSQYIWLSHTFYMKCVPPVLICTSIAGPYHVFKWIEGYI